MPSGQSGCLCVCLWLNVSVYLCLNVYVCQYVCRCNYWRVNIKISMSMSVGMCVFFENISIYVHIPLYIKAYAYMSVHQTCSISDVVLLVFVLLVFGNFGDAQRFVLGAAVGLRGRVADIIAALIHVIGAFISIAILVHGIEEDEDAEGGSCHDAYHHACGAAALPYHLRWTWEHLHFWQGRAGCKKQGRESNITLQFTTYIINLNFMWMWWV